MRDALNPSMFLIVMIKIIFIGWVLLFSACSQKDKTNINPQADEGWIATYNVAFPDNVNASQKLKVQDYFSKSLDSSNAEILDITYPSDSSVFPPDLTSPLFTWNNPNLAANLWLIEISFNKAQKILILRSSQGPPSLIIDSTAIPKNNPFQLERPEDMEAWEVPAKLWEFIKKATQGKYYSLKITGFNDKQGDEKICSHRLTLKTSQDSVGAPVFYRDVPFMPILNQKKGKVLPLDNFAMQFINWRLRDVSKPQSKVVLTDMPTCANCHTFSKDGKRLGMDIDGTQGDKGAYGIQNITKKTVFEREDIISWNYDFKKKTSVKPTFGFLSSLSPDGKQVVTTVNEELFVVGYVDQGFSQVFYPTRGILAWYDRNKGEALPLPGADDPLYVHCSPTWTPDGKTIIFSRARAKDPYTPNQKMPAKANDPEETPIQYDLYRIDFNEGKGGKPIRIAGASQNGMSNNFAKVTPDGKYIVFVKCRNGLLMRPDSKLWIVPIEGGQARLMKCNTWRMNSWHSFSPNGKWMVFASKKFTIFTQLFLTHLDEKGNDTPPILIPYSTADNRASNLPEFANIDYDELDTIEVPAVSHFNYRLQAGKLIDKGVNRKKAIQLLRKALEEEKEDRAIRADIMVTLGDLLESNQETIKMFEQAITEDPDYGEGYLMLGLALEKEGEEEKALKVYHKLLTFRPEDFYAMIQLCKIYLLSSNAEIQNVDLAFKYIQKANELTYSQKAYVLQNLARVYSELGEFSQAVETAQLGRQRALEIKDHSRAQKIAVEQQAFENKRKFSSIITKNR